MSQQPEINTDVNKACLFGENVTMCIQNSILLTCKSKCRNSVRKVAGVKQILDFIEFKNFFRHVHKKELSKKLYKNTSLKYGNMDCQVSKEVVEAVDGLGTI